ncbi:MAG: aminomethyltransferase beta-barrel domain-containing protein, partial [Litorimonas sp.]
VKVRSTRPPERATLHVEGGRVTVRLAEPEAGISPGQACVFYEDRDDAQRTLGGGWITGTA